VDIKIKGGSKMKLEKCILSLNLKSLEKLSLAIGEGQKVNPEKEIVLARFGDEEWIKAIRKKEWNKISQMYSSTRFGTIMQIAGIIKKLQGDLL
jgi:hypothetical protein